MRSSQPVYFREPSVNLGVGGMAGKPPHLVGDAFLKHFGIAPKSRLAHAFTYLDFAEAAHRYGRLGGFAHLKTLVDRLRAEAGAGRSLLLDGGDLWQGSGLANIDAWRGHGGCRQSARHRGDDRRIGNSPTAKTQLRANIKRFKGEFLAQNVFLTEEAAFDNKPAFDAESGRAFKPATIKELGGFRIGVIGQALPYVPIAHPKRFTPDWTFGIREPELQKLVDGLRQKDKVDAVILLSHNGMDLDLKLASRVTGIDVILGGHTHDAVPQPVTVANAGGKTLVTNAGSAGKFLGVLDLELAKGAVKDVRYHLLPVYAGLLKADPAMQALHRQRHASRMPRPSARSWRWRATCSTAAAISTAAWTSSSATRCATSSTPRSRCRPASAGATRCCRAKRSPWTTCCRRPPSPIRKSTCRR